ncbi:MAG TPA: trypsin-like peptidase domain-containing protein [Chthoniobacteraceae bacterium]|nr:trypsin-like peptidase domain-containing protein [Chthoniobacteraceae bacterium]
MLSLNITRFLAIFCISCLLGGENLTAQAVTQPEAEPAVKAVAKAMPAVVNINTERTIRRFYRDPADEFFYQFFGAQPPPRQVREKVQSLGSGFIIDASGYIITNEHVVERAENLKIKVTTSDGKTYPARYVTGDPLADIALLKIESDAPLPFISLDEPSPNLLGQSILVVGNPLGYGHSVARGILSATNRSFTVENMEFTNLLQTDAAINPGNSGGPLIDLQGKLVGVASAKMAYTPQGVPTQGIGFAIPAATIAEKVAEFKRNAESARRNGEETGQPHARARLGLTLQDLTPQLGEALGLEQTTGVLISDVEPGSPAHMAGLRRGMVIYRIGRNDIATAGDAERVLQQARTGSEIDLGVGIVRRAGRRVFEQLRTVSVTAR